MIVVLTAMYNNACIVLFSYNVQLSVCPAYGKFFLHCLE